MGHVAGRKHRKTLVVAYVVHEAGHREVIGLDMGPTESGTFWRQFLRDLVARGLADAGNPTTTVLRGYAAAAGPATEGGGFEPPAGGCPATVFKTAAFDRSATPPRNRYHTSPRGEVAEWLKAAAC